ncbi:hypothetical protein F5Y12DRAFT_746962 [Xylaria sp. FL1777]|nr:hypothetical protein F5Y12DRAFT_746962 [Xylaria sp. FL1777]
MHRNVLPLALCLGATLAQGQTGNTGLQSAGFNSTFTLSQAQISAANLSEGEASDVENAVRFAESLLANGGPAADDFYTLPELDNASSTLKPGVLLKVQDYTDPTSFTLAPNTALSRILYTTTNLNGTVVPASAFVLWPFQPRVFTSSSSSTDASDDGQAEQKKAPVVLWYHGTSGFFAPQAPSTHRALYYGHEAPFTLALDGYAVVAPDYAGLGVQASWDGSAVPHQYLMSRISAADGLYALRAARAAFPDQLADEFVAFGQSQGGGVAWGTAEVLAGANESDTDFDFADLLLAYRGAIATSPVTKMFTGDPHLILPWVTLYLPAVFPSFNIADWLTPLGIARTQLLREVEGDVGVSQQLYLADKVIQDSWNETWYVDALNALANVGSRPIAGPLLVIHGSIDTVVSPEVTSLTVNETFAYFASAGIADANLEYLVVDGAGHVPALDATRPLWLQWIRDRFEGRPLENPGCVTRTLDSWLPISRYLAVGNSYPQWAGAPEYAYETPLGP